MAYSGPEYWEVIYKAVADFSDLLTKAAAAKTALDALKKSSVEEGQAEAKAALAAAAARKKDIDAIGEQRRALDMLASSAKQSQVWTDWGGRNSAEAHLSDLERELNLKTLINRQEWLGFTTPQQAFAWRTNELNQRKQMNYAEWAGYQTADQYLSYLQKQRSELASLNTELLARAAAYRSVTDAALSNADATRGTHASISQLSEGIDLSGISQFQQALTGLPDIVTTQVTVDDSDAISRIAQYEALLRSIPATETTVVSSLGGLTPAQVRGAVTVAAPVSVPQQAERIPVSFTGPYQDQFAMILADIARLKAEKAEIPVDFSIDPTEVAALKARLGQLDVSETVVQHLVSQGGGIGGGGGPPPVAPGAAAEPPDDAAGKWAALAAAMKAAGAEADADAIKLAAVRAAAAGDADSAAKLAYAYQQLTAGSRDAEESTAALVPKLDLTSDSVLRLAGRWGALSKDISLFGGMFGSTALIGSVGLWHIALDGIIEALALLIPAVVTATAGLIGWGLAAAQAGQQVYNQMKNVLTVSSALNTVVPPLKGNFQQLQDAVRPQAWQLFGDALDLVNGRTGVFQNLIMQTGRVLDEFGARLVVDMQRGGKGLQTFFDTGAKVLGMLGQIALNVGHAFANLVRATEITHIAEILLGVVAVLSKLLDIITKLPAPVLALLLGLHGLELWGGLAVTWLSKVALGFVSLLSSVGPLNGVMATLAGRLGASDDQLVKIAGHAPAVKAVADAMGQNAAQIAQFAVAADKSGKSVSELAASTENGAALFDKYGRGLSQAGQDAVNLAIAAGATEEQIARVAASSSAAAADTGFFSSALAKVGGVAGLATAGLVALAAAAAVFAYKSLTAKDAAQQWIDSINKGLASQSLFTVVGKNVADLAAVTDQLSHAQGLNAQAVHELTGEQTALSDNLQLALPRIGQVSKAYGTDMVGSLELLNLAGVKTSDLFTKQGLVWATDLQMVKGLIDGYQAMGQQLGTVGSDLNVLLVSESQQIKSMQQLNQAWDAWLGTVTGGESTFVKVQQDFLAIDTAQQTAGASMTGLNKQSLTLRSAFISMVPDAGKVLDAIRAQTATMSSGAAGGALMTRATKDLAAEMIPLAGNSADARAAVLALAQEADPSITTWQKLTQWVGNRGAAGAALDLQDVLFKLAIPVSDLQQDAAKLSSTLQSDLNPAMAQAEFNALGGQKAFNTFATDLAKFGPDSQVTITAGRNVAQMLLSIDKNSATAKNQFVAWAESMGLSQKQADALWQKVSAGQRPLESMRQGLASSATASDKLFNSGFFAQRGDTFRTNMQQMGAFFGKTLPDAFKTAGEAVGRFFAGPFTDFFTKTVPHVAGDVATFFSGPFRTSVEAAWSHVWSSLVSPVVKLTDDVKHQFTSGFDSWWKSHGTAVESIWNSVTGNLAMAWDNFTGGLKRAWDTFTSWFHGSGDVTKGLAASWDQFYSSGVKPVLDKIQAAWKITFGAMEAIAKITFDAIALVLKTVWDAAMLVLKVAWDTVVAVISVAIDLLTGHWKTAWTDVTNWFKQVMNAVWAFLQQGFNNFINFFRQLWNNALSFLTQAWHNFWNWFYSNIVQSGFGHFLTSTLPGWFNDVVSFFENSWKKSWNWFSSNIIAPWNRLFTVTFPGWLNDIGRFFANTWTTVWRDFSSSVIGPMGRWFSSTLPNAIHNGFRDAINWVIDNVINKVINFINNDILKHLPGSLHISTVGNVATGGDVGAAAGMASGGPFARMSGSVPGASAVDGTAIMAMGGEYMVRQPARMALEAHFGRGFMNWLNQFDQHAGSGSRGTMASQQVRPGVNYAIGGLVNPIGRGLRPERVDMGVDYGGAGPLYALGSGQVTSVYNSGWPGGTFIDLRLNPTYGSGYWYYAEDISPLVKVGQGVSAGQHIANATGGGSGIEVGWASGNGGQTEADATGQDKLGLSHGDPGAYPTAWGVAASNLIHSLGGPAGIISGKVQGGTAGIGGAIAAIWQSVEGLLDAAGTGVGDLIKPLGSFISGGASELLKLARQGAAALFNAVWDHSVRPITDLVPGDSIPGALLQGIAGELRQGIDNFMTGQDQQAQSTAASSGGGGGGAVGPVSGPADAGPGQAENYAKGRLGIFGWGSGQWPPLQSLWQRESGWNRFARNPSSGAYGIPQALPPTKLPPAGQAGGGSHASPQIDWGMSYIKNNPMYGSPSAAWAHELAHGWYAGGGAIGGDGASAPWDGAVMAAGGSLTDWSPLYTAVRSEMAAMDAIQAARLPAKGPTAAERRAFTDWQKALWAQQTKTVGLGRGGAFSALYANAYKPSGQTSGQWSAFTGDLSYLLREEEGPGAGGINPPGTPANSGYAAWKYLRSPWQRLLDSLRIASSRATAARTQWGSRFSLTPTGPGGTGQTGTDSPEWDSASRAMNTAVRAELDNFWKLSGSNLSAIKGVTPAQAGAWHAWRTALDKQQYKTFGLGTHPPGAYQAISDRLTAPGTITAGQWSSFLSGLAYETREVEGPGAGGINPPGTPANSGWVPWHYFRGKWQTVLNTLRTAAARTRAAQTVWGTLYGPGALPSTPGPPVTPGPGTPPGSGSSSGLVNVMPEATMGGPSFPVRGAVPDMGFAAGGGLDQVASMFSGGISPGGVMLPVVVRHGIPDSVLRQLSGDRGAPGGSRPYPRTLSEAGGSHYGPALNVEQLNINNPLPQRPSDSIAHAANRLAFLGGRMN